MASATELKKTLAEYRKSGLIIPPYSGMNTEELRVLVSKYKRRTPSPAKKKTPSERGKTPSPSSPKSTPRKSPFVAPPSNATKPVLIAWLKARNLPTDGLVKDLRTRINVAMVKSVQKSTPRSRSRSPRSRSPRSRSPHSRSRSPRSRSRSPRSRSSSRSRSPGSRSPRSRSSSRSPGSRKKAPSRSPSPTSMRRRSSKAKTPSSKPKMTGAEMKDFLFACKTLGLEIPSISGKKVSEIYTICKKIMKEHPDIANQALQSLAILNTPVSAQQSVSAPALAGVIPPGRRSSAHFPPPLPEKDESEMSDEDFLKYLLDPPNLETMTYTELQMEIKLLRKFDPTLSARPSEPRLRIAISQAREKALAKLMGGGNECGLMRGKLQGCSDDKICNLSTGKCITVSEVPKGSVVRVINGVKLIGKESSLAIIARLASKLRDGKPIIEIINTTSDIDNIDSHIDAIRKPVIPGVPGIDGVPPIPSFDTIADFFAHQEAMGKTAPTVSEYEALATTEGDGLIKPLPAKAIVVTAGQIDMELLRQKINELVIRPVVRQENMSQNALRAVMRL